MLEPLAAQQVVLLEQPLAPDLDPTQDTAGFAALHPHCPMALVADESCWDLEDLLRLAPVVDGVNLKLLKVRGAQSGLAHCPSGAEEGLDLMVGANSDSSC